MTEIDAIDIRVSTNYDVDMTCTCETCGAKESHYNIGNCLESLVKRVAALEAAKGEA